MLGTVQFGAQANPNTYFGTIGSPCRPGTGDDALIDTVIDAQLVSVGDDALDVRISYRYPDHSDCTLSTITSEACDVIWEIDCARSP